MMPLRLFIIFTFIVLVGNAQQRIALDVSSRLENANFTFSYHKVVKTHFLLSSGVFYGGNGSSYSGKDTLLFDSGVHTSSPFAQVNNARADSDGTYALLDYGTQGKSFGILIGAGYFYPINENHSLRANVYSKFGYATSNVRAYYRLDATHNDMKAGFTMSHAIASFSFELYHGIKMSDRFAAYYGVKFPYYYSPNKAKFNPLIYKDLYYGFEPELSLGISYFIGKVMGSKENTSNTIDQN
ncbi:MAG: hypothetical protein WC044_11495 [Crocinitomicaceae bacterium]